MNKFFKRILPATILATCCTVSVFSMTACNEGKDYSDDITKLQQELENLKTENNSLKDKVNNLTPGDTDYTEEIEKLQQQIEALKGQNASYLQESEKLKQQIETLKTNNESNLSEISKLEQQLENLKTNNENNLAEIDKLQQQIEAQKKLIESLQSATSTQPKIYKVGETFKYTYQGIDYFSLTFKDKNHIEITNLNMIGSKISEYIRVKAIESDGRSSILSYSDKILVKNETYSLSLKIFNAVTTYLIGFPLPDSGLMPYVIVDITASI